MLVIVYCSAMMMEWLKCLCLYSTHSLIVRRMNSLWAAVGMSACIAYYLKYLHTYIIIWININTNGMEGYSRDGKIKTCTNKIFRDNHTHYTSLHLLFSIIMHQLMVTHWCYFLCMHVGEIHLIHYHLICGGGIISLDCRTIASLVNSCTYSKSKRRDV